MSENDSQHDTPAIPRCRSTVGPWRCGRPHGHRGEHAPYAADVGRDIPTLGDYQAAAAEPESADDRPPREHHDVATRCELDDCPLVHQPACGAPDNAYGVTCNRAGGHDGQHSHEHRGTGVAWPQEAEPAMSPADHVFGGRNRAAEARALLSAADTIKATAGAVEIAGVRIEACDTYGQTETTRRLDQALADLALERSVRAKLAEDRDRVVRLLERSRRRADALSAELAARDRAEHNLEAAGPTWQHRALTVDKRNRDLRARVAELEEQLDAARRLLRDQAELIAADRAHPETVLVCGARTALAGRWRECDLPDGHDAPHESRALPGCVWR